MADEIKPKETETKKETALDKVEKNLKGTHEKIKDNIGNAQMKQQGAPVTDNKDKKEEKKEEKKKEPAKVKKEEAIAWGRNLHASLKHCMFLSEFIKDKTIDAAIADLDLVIKLKKIVPFRGEIPHRKGNYMSGRYPVNSSKTLIPVLKGLKGNALANLMDLDKTRITFSSPSWASRASKRSGGRFKRVNILIKAREVKS